MWTIKIFKIQCLLFSSDTKQTMMHLFLFTNSARKVYATAINCPCIITLNWICASELVHNSDYDEEKLVNPGLNKSG